jgi:type III secretion protein D
MELLMVAEDNAELLCGAMQTASTETASNRHAKSFRVLSGLHQGASLEVAPGRWFLLGSADDSDIVVSDPAVFSHHCLISPNNSGFSLRVLAGTVAVPGRTCTEGQTFRLDDFTLCQIGSMVFSVGSQSKDVWTKLGMDVESLLSSSEVQMQNDVDNDSTSAAGQTYVADVTSKSGSDKANPRARLFPGSATGLFRTGFTVLGVCLVAVGMWWAISYASTGQVDPARINTLVAKLGLDEISVEQSHTGQLEIKGVIPAESQRARLMSELSQLGIHPKMSIVTGEHLARSAEDTFRQNGLNAEAKYVAHGKLEIAGLVPTVQAKEAASQILLSIKGVKDIAFSESSTIHDKLPEQAQHIKTVGGNSTKSDGKRIAAVVGGSEPFIVTADGGRYGLGAILSDGSVVEHIEDNVVRFRRGEEAVAFKF